MFFLWQIFSLLTSSQTDLSLGGRDIFRRCSTEFLGLDRIFVPNLGIRGVAGLLRRGWPIDWARGRRSPESPAYFFSPTMHSTSGGAFKIFLQCTHNHSIAPAPAFFFSPTMHSTSGDAFKIEVCSTYSSPTMHSQSLKSTCTPSYKQCRVTHSK